jgi:hypothetical protein
MKINIELDLDTIFQNVAETVLSEETLKPLITKKLEETLKSAVESAMGYNSTFRKNLEASIASAMPTDLENISRYNDMVYKLLKNEIEAKQGEYIKQGLLDRLSSTLKTMPQELTVTALIEMLMHHLEQHHLKEANDYRPTILVELTGSGPTRGFFNLYIDPKEDVSKYSCLIKLKVSNKGEVYSVVIGDTSLDKALFIGPTYGLERVMLNLYANSTRLILDAEDYDDVCYPE